jgi:hypothetical protein
MYWTTDKNNNRKASLSPTSATPSKPRLKKLVDQDRPSLTVADQIKEHFANRLIDLDESDRKKTPNEILNMDKKLKSKHKRLFRKLSKLKERKLISDMPSKFAKMVYQNFNILS